MFLDDTACNLASLNLLQFRDASGEEARFDTEAFEHAVRLWTVVLEISVLMAQFPSKEIALRSFDYRTLGLGYANIGGLLMTSGIPYNSPQGRAICGAITAIMTGIAYATSAEMAGELGAFPAYERNKEPMLRVIRNHARAAHGHADGYETLATNPVPLDHASLETLGDNGKALSEHARSAWVKAVNLGEAHGYRNAQVSVIAPTGTIGLVMDCDTTGIEPDFALVKFKKLAGGGYFKIINRAVPEALATLGYSLSEDADIIAYAVGRGTLKDAPGVNHETLKEKGFTDAKLAELEKGLTSAFDIKFAFNKWSLGEEFCRDVLKLDDEQLADPQLDLLGRHRLLQEGHRGGQHLLLRGDDAGRRAAPEGGASAGVRLRQRLRAARQALPLLGEPHPHDGGGAALHLRRHLQDHQHAQQRHGGGLQGRLHALLEAGR